MNDVAIELINEDEKIPLLEKIDPEKITIGDGVIRIIAQRERHDFEGNLIKTPEMFIDLAELDWHFDDYGFYYYLSLTEIEKQLLELKYKPPFYVWHDDALRGVIYEYGNYNPLSWVKHGETKGYA